LSYKCVELASITLRKQYRLRVFKKRETLGSSGSKWQENGEKCTVRSFMICMPHQKGNQIKEGGMGKRSATYGREEKCIWNFGRNN
jgi:hypothetical protein